MYKFARLAVVLPHLYMVAYILLIYYIFCLYFYGHLYFASIQNIHMKKYLLQTPNAYQFL